MKNSSDLKRSATFMRDKMPEYLQKSGEFGEETVQTVVWVVGLSGTLLVFIASSPSFLSGLPHAVRVLLCLLLGGTACLGVLQRIVYRIVAMKNYDNMLDLHAFLAEWTDDSPPLLAPSEGRSRAMIIDLLHQATGLDYAFLETYDVPLDECHRMYSEAYQQLTESQRGAKEYFWRVVAAYENMPEDKLLQFLSGKTDPLVSVRQKAKTLKRWQECSLILFYATCCSFIFSVVGLTLAAIVKAK